MRQANAGIHIRDGHSAANAYSVLATLGAPTKLPTDANELARQLRRVNHRGRELVVALERFVEARGFDALVAAVEGKNCSASVSIEERESGTRSAAAAAAAASHTSFPSAGDEQIRFALSGFY